MSTLFLNYFESELLYRDGPFIKSVSSDETRKKFDILKIAEQPLQGILRFQRKKRNQVNKTIVSVFINTSEIMIYVDE